MSSKKASFLSFRPKIIILGDCGVGMMCVFLQQKSKCCNMDKKLTFKKVAVIVLMAVAYLATFILGAASGAIHPACYAYIGAVLPILTAFIYLYTCT